MARAHGARLEETIAGLTARLETEYQDTLAARLHEAAQSGKTAHRELIQKLNQTARRLRHFENEASGRNTLVDSTRGFCGRAALFLVRDRKLHLEADAQFRRIAGRRRMSLSMPRPRLPLPLKLATPWLPYARRVNCPSPLIQLLCANPATSATCFPWSRGRRSGSAFMPIRTNGRRRTGTSGGHRRRRDGRPPSAPSTSSGNLSVHLRSIAPAQKPEILSWFTLSREDRELHLRAQRFARVQVAEIRLYQSEKVKNGRTAHDLYTSLQRRDRFRARGFSP